MTPITIGLAQIYPTLGDIEKNRAIVRDGIERARAAGVDLLVFPELALSGYFLKDIVPYAAVLCLDGSRALGGRRTGCGPGGPHGSAADEAVEQLEKIPDSPGRQMVLKEELEMAGLAKSTDLKELATLLAEALREQGLIHTL